MRNAIFAALTVIAAGHSAAAQHQLHCQPDDAPGAAGLRLQLDTTAGTMTQLFGSEAKPLQLQMRESGTEWIGEWRLSKDVGDLKAGTVMMSVSVDTYTLKFSMFSRGANAYGMPEVVSGQCKQLQRQL